MLWKPDRVAAADGPLQYLKCVEVYVYCNVSYQSDCKKLSFGSMGAVKFILLIHSLLFCLLKSVCVSQKKCWLLCRYTNCPFKFSVLDSMTGCTM